MGTEIEQSKDDGLKKGAGIKQSKDDGLKKLEYLSLVSKVCTELETHSGFGDKVLAEFITEMGRRCETVDDFDAKLKENKAEMPDYFVRTLLTIIHAILPPKVNEKSEIDLREREKSGFSALKIKDSRDRVKELEPKAFAAGVILATGFVHMLPDATSALTNSCLPKLPWSKFPFSGFIAMIASLGTLLVDFLGTQYYERKQENESPKLEFDSSDVVSELGIVPVEKKRGSAKVFGEEEGGAMHIVGMRAHAAHHRHSHLQEEGACEGRVKEYSHGHSHSHAIEGGRDEEGGLRHVVVSQVLELGIVSHSVIIGLSLGVSHNPCTIRPLIGALSFHQFFEGFALGGCISQAKFTSLRATIMACFFALTTPLGIAVGTGISSIYNPDSPRALVIEGIFDSISSGILVYMALVDLIAADFLSKRMSCNLKLQIVSYFALFIGAGLMSSLALWA